VRGRSAAVVRQSDRQLTLRLSDAHKIGSLEPGWRWSVGKKFMAKLSAQASGCGVHVRGLVAYLGSCVG
jgi:hypothetical protein